MKKAWAISGVDLLLEVAPTRVRAGLEVALRDAIASRRLAPGSRLPSSRQLASDLGMARNTVAEAYGQLVAEGWLIARQGSGTRVAALPPPADQPPRTASAAARPAYDLTPGLPNLASFPADAWVGALRRSLAAAPVDLLGYGDPRGLPQLREVLAGYLARARGVHAHPDRILVCSGFGQALALLAQVLRADGAGTVATEAHSRPAHRRLLSYHGLASRPVPVDEDGAVVDRLGADDAVLLTPAHQFPLGVTLSAARRAAVTGWAADGGGLVIEDDYDGELRYDRRPVGALQALAPDHVVYVGTASKTLAPGVRLGWMVAPPGLLDRLVAAKDNADGHSSVLNQLALAELIRSGGYDRHVRRCRLAYRRRRDRLTAVLREPLPATAVTGIAAGMHAVVGLPPGIAEADVEAAALRAGVVVEGLDRYRQPGGPDRTPALVVGYGTPPDHAYAGALERLQKILASGRG